MTKEELKQEAKEYADKYGKSNFDIWDTARFAYYQSAEPREKRIAELEKENAELKGIKDVATLIRANNDTVTTLMQLNNMLVSKTQQLTNAKEIIRSLYFVIQDRIDYKGNIPLEDEMYRAEQFLKESEVEK